MFWRKKKYLSKSSVISGTKKTTLSFCIPHRDRFEYLKQTLRKNLNDNSSHTDQVDFVLVDFGSEEDVTGWISSEFSGEIKSGFLKYYTAEGLGEWHASIAKNTTHRLAGGDILVNLDCDNYTGKEGGKVVIDHFQRADENILLWQYSKKKLDGTFGRIALTRDLFNELGGYDESLLQMGYQDGDLKDRAVALGAKLVHDRDPSFNQAIKNEKFVPQSMSWKRMNEYNENLSRKNIRAGNLIANEGRTGGLANCKILTSELELTNL